MPDLPTVPDRCQSVIYRFCATAQCFVRNEGPGPCRGHREADCKLPPVVVVLWHGGTAVRINGDIPMAKAYCRDHWEDRLAEACEKATNETVTAHGYRGYPAKEPGVKT